MGFTSLSHLRVIPAEKAVTCYGFALQPSRMAAQNAVTFYGLVFLRSEKVVTCYGAVGTMRLSRATVLWKLNSCHILRRSGKSGEAGTHYGVFGQEGVAVTCAGIK